MVHPDDRIRLSDNLISSDAGTVNILEDTATRVTNPADRDPNLRYDKSGEILLVPQPSNDPNE